MNASISFTRCGVSSTYLFQMPVAICCASFELRILVDAAEEREVLDDEGDLTGVCGCARVGCEEPDVCPWAGVATDGGTEEGGGARLGAIVRVC